MYEELIGKLNEVGVDSKVAIGRFAGKESLYVKFLRKFLEDSTFEKIAPALNADEMDQALAAAHTLKGISGNLGMDRLYKACSELVSQIRSQEYDEAKASYTEVSDAYRQVYELLNDFREVNE